MYDAKSKFPGIIVAALLAGLVPAAASAQGNVVFTGQAYHIGDPSSQAPDITLQCNSGDITAAGDCRIIIPPGLNCEWDTTITTPGWNDPNNLCNHTVSYPSVKICYINVTTDFAFRNATIIGLRFRNFTAASVATSLGLDKNNDNVADAFSSPGQIRIAGNPASMVSLANQVFPVGDPSTANSQITITENASNPGIWAATDLRIRIPAGLNMEWDTTDTTATMTGTGAGHVSSTVSFPGVKVMLVSVLSDFGAGQTLIINNLAFRNFTAPSGPLPLTVEVNTNGTTAATDIRTKQVVPAVTISSLANQVFAVGDPVTPISQITIQDSSGVAQITTANDIRIHIPTTNMSWDTTDFTATFGGTAAGKVGAISYPDNQTLFITVTVNFAPSDTLTISNLGFTNFTAATGPVTLEVEVDGDPTPEGVDNRTKSIGAPTLLSNANQSFTVGALPTPISPFVVTESAVPVITAAGDIRVRIPAAFNMEWDTTITTATIGMGPGTGVVNTTVSYPDTHTLLLNVTTGFSANQSVTVSNLSFRNFTAPSLPSNLQLQVNPAGSNPIADLDNRTIVIGGFPTITSTSNQAFTVNDPSTAMVQINLQDANGSPTITAANDIRIHIPAGFNMVWDTTDNVAACAGTAVPAKVAAAPTVTFEDANQTVVIPVSANFAINDTLIISGLSFRFFTAPSGPANLWLEVDNLGTTAATDANTKAIGCPTITSAGNQAFAVGDPATAIATITVTEDAAAPRITAANDVRITIPAGMNMEWDTTDTAATVIVGGPGAGVVSGTVSYFGTKTLILDVTTGLSAGQTITVSNLSFRNFTAPSGPLSLGLNVSNLGTLCSTDPTTLTVDNRPTITSVLTRDQNGNGSIDAVQVTFSKDIDGTTASATTGIGFTISGFSIVSAAETSPGVLMLYLLDQGVPNGALKPTLTYDPITGSLLDSLGLETPAYGPTAMSDGIAPTIVSMAAYDDDGNGKLDRVVFTYSEAMAAGQEDINDWRLLDADGVTNLLAGLTNANLSISGNTLTITLANTTGTPGTPVYSYLENGAGGEMQDVNSPLNLAPTQTGNHPPVVNAGFDRAYGPTLVKLSGTVSDPDNQPVVFSWSQVGGTPVVLQNPASLTPSFLANLVGAYTFRLSASDPFTTVADDVIINIANVPAAADAGFDQTVLAGAVVTLDATRTFDVNGETFGAGLTAAWTQVSGPAVALAGAATPTATFNSAGLNDTFIFRVDITDSGGEVSSSTVVVRVNAPGNAVPTADAGPDQVGEVGTTVTLDGRFSVDPEGGPLNYTWTPNVLLTGPATVTPSFVPTGPGIFTFQLTVKDAGGATSAPSTVTIYVPSPGNALPEAVAFFASPNTDVVTGDKVTLHAHLSIDPESQPLGFAWIQVAGPRVEFDHFRIPHADIYPPQAGTAVFKLIVDDQVQQGPPVYMNVPIKATSFSTLPHAYVAVDPSDDLGGGRVDIASAPILLNGAGSVGTGISHHWVQVGGPSVVLSAPGSATPSFTPVISGRYVFTDTVIDVDGVRDTATLNVVVDTPGNTSPTADAGVDRAGVVGAGVQLNGSASSDSAADADGITGFSNGLIGRWEQTGGPPVRLNGQTSSGPVFVPTAPGVYFFNLVVRDNVASSKPDAMIVVAEAPLPAANEDNSRCGLLGIEAVVVLAGLAMLRRK